MTVPLDSLLPIGPGGHIPESSGDFFNSGSSFWEHSDRFQWKLALVTEQWPAFRWGWEAATFEVALKMGRPFSVPRPPEQSLPVFLNRAREYSRVVHESHGGGLVVSGHAG